MKKSKRKITCPYCGSPAILREGNYVYGEDSIAEKLYVCQRYPDCDAYVGVFKDNRTPKGTLANSELRNKRIRAHRAFDEIWKSGIMSRGQAYQWMQHKFGLSKDQAHIGYFSDYLCLQLIEACNEVLENTKERGADL